MHLVLFALSIFRLHLMHDMHTIVNIPVIAVSVRQSVCLVDKFSYV